MIIKFIIQHQNSTSYYLQGNGQVELTNKVLKAVFTKIINVNQIDWNIKLHLVLWAYCIAFKVTAKHTPFFLNLWHKSTFAY